MFDDDGDDDNDEDDLGPGAKGSHLLILVFSGLGCL